MTLTYKLPTPKQPEQHVQPQPHPHVQPHPPIAQQPVYRPPVVVQQPVYRQPVVVQRYYQPQPYYQSGPNPVGFLGGLIAGTILGRALANNRQHAHHTSQSYQPDTGEAISPRKFDIMMNAAMQGSESGVDRYNRIVHTTPRERQIFKQLVFTMLDDAHRPIDGRAMFSPDALSKNAAGMLRDRLGSRTSHFSADFTNPALGKMVYDNQSMLSTKYRTAYNEELAKHRPPSHYQQTAYSSYPVQPRNVIRIL